MKSIRCFLLIFLLQLLVILLQLLAHLRHLLILPLCLPQRPYSLHLSLRLRNRLQSSQTTLVSYIWRHRPVCSRREPPASSSMTVVRSVQHGAVELDKEG